MAVKFSTVADPFGDIHTGGNAENRMIFGDFDNDGDKDVLFQDGGTAGAGFGYFENNGDGTFTKFTDANAAGLPFDTADFTGQQLAFWHVVDYDNDGDEDILDREATGGLVAYRNDNGVFSLQADPLGDIHTGGTAENRLVMGDFDNDGDIDVLYQDSNTAGVGFGYFENQGDGTFDDFTDANAAGTPFDDFDFTGQQGEFLFAVDYDNDGDVDIIDRNVPGGLGIWRNDGGSFSLQADPFGDIHTAGVAEQRMLFGDFDSDGDIDALFQDDNATGVGFGYFKNNGDGTFVRYNDANDAGTPFSTLDFSAQIFSATATFAVDYDNDGDIDIIDRDTVGGMEIWEQGSDSGGDGSPPVLVSSTPTDDATGVAVGASIVVTFDETVVKGAGDITIVRVSDGAVFETIPVTDARVTGSGTTWTINPTGTLAGSTEYAVQFDVGTFVDSDGAVFFGIDDRTTLSFTTAAPNVAPSISNLNGDSAAFTEDGAAVALDSGSDATVTDGDSASFDGGSLTVSIVANENAAEDVLGIDTSGSVSLSAGLTIGSSVSVSGTAIGTIAANGTGGNDLVVSLNGNATSALTQDLVRALTYSNSDTADPSTAARTVRVTLSDGDGGTSTDQDITVNVAAVNDAPSGADTTLVVDEDDFYEFDPSDFGFTDPDNNDFAGVVITTLPTAGVLYLYDPGTFDRSAVAAGDTISYDDLDDANLEFWPDSEENGPGYGSFTFQVMDDGGTVGGGNDLDATPNTITFDVTAVNDAPRIALQRTLDYIITLRNIVDPLFPVPPVGVGVGFGDGSGGLYPPPFILPPLISPVELYDTGDLPSAVVVADLDGDGDLDIVVVNGGSNDLTLLEGDNCGCFDPFPSDPIDVGVFPTSVAVGDLNNDSLPDMVVSNAGNNNVSVLLGAGGGDFTPVTPVAVGSVPGAVALADLNGDTFLDIVTTNPGNKTISFALGNNDGTFGTATTFASGDIAAFVVADIDGDTEMDIVAADVDNNGFAIFSPNGSGGYFRASTTAGPPGAKPADIEVADVTGDGALDVVLTESGLNRVTVWSGDGAGAFTLDGTYAVGTDPRQSVLGDVDDDGDLDIVTANRNSKTISVLLNDGNGVFTLDSDPIALPGNPIGIALGNVDPEAEEDGSTPLFLQFKEGDVLKLTPKLVISDPDGGTAVGAEVFIDNPFFPPGIDGDVLSVDTTGTSITASYNSITATLTLSSVNPESLADYQKVLRTLTFQSGEDPDLDGTCTERIIDIVVDDGTDEGLSAPIFLDILADDDDPVAKDDSFITTESSSVSGGVLDDNGSGADSDPDDPLEVLAVAGTAITGMGTVVPLASGAYLSFNPDGTFTYVPSAAMSRLPAFFGSGASNTTFTETFTYLITGGAFATVTITVRGLDTNDELQGSNTADTLTAGIGNDTVLGYEGADEITGNTGNDELRGAAGNDTISGNKDNDTIYGAGDDDLLYGGHGTDSVIGGAGNDTLFGGGLGIEVAPDSDTLSAGTGDDSADGGGGNDLISGGEGKDTLSGGLHDDQLFGEDHDDLIYGDDGADWADGGAGNDSIYGGFAGPDNVAPDSDTLMGGAGDDYLHGNPGDDVLSGGTGNDTVIGAIGNDLVQGDDNNDLLGGGAGSDTLDGGAGADSMIGGAGADYFVFADAWGQDSISGFTDGEDLLDLSNVTGVTSFGDLTVTQVALGTLITFGADTILLQGFTATNLSAADFTPF